MKYESHTIFYRSNHYAKFEDFALFLEITLFKLILLKWLSKVVFFLWKIINLTRVRAFHKLLGNFLAISCISGNFFLFEQPFAFWAISLVIF